MLYSDSWFYAIWFPVSPCSRITYSEVEAFLEKQYTMITMYKSITTSQFKKISLTGSHLIFTKKEYADQFDPMQVFFNLKK